ncbi:hypothetical protein OS965_09645 [Streptomyces sp. H27-G5]|uniref:hypothetical protein n=1 Tax=Streptomyces sp. H27-G5 TaxID=2996698 RepID=UPI0022717A67|nr:hypothetical protein [Streptomyces sp. H27-G5]MCY0918437.1 hypothetical protein [Streptomyces sp. H27-G5]
MPPAPCRATRRKPPTSRGSSGARAVARGLAELLAALVLSMPLAVTGTILCTTERQRRDGEGPDEATRTSKGWAPKARLRH